ncbi:MAG: shikimate kinase [Acidithiobacillales bacterium SG8_45]|jgi:shikimate kinase|nr:MAG: shikimate kinase [Acidithiobacillales bacterium SG8_45]
MDIPQNIFLVGPMGAGKSTIGRYLAELLDRQFKDSDHEIEKRTGASIPLIFEIEGESGFRTREAAMLLELADEEGAVIATGGGIVLSEENREILKEKGLVVYLHASIDILYQRTRRDRNRPLLNDGDRRTKLEDIMRTRDPLYREVATLIIETDKRPARSVAKEIVDKIESLNHENA